MHCSAGRDRTGVLVALALSVAGVPPASIAADYARTDGCSGDTMLRMLSHLDDRHGGARTYLPAGGATGAQLERARNRLLSQRFFTPISNGTVMPVKRQIRTPRVGTIRGV